MVVCGFCNLGVSAGIQEKKTFLDVFVLDRNTSHLAFGLYISYLRLIYGPSSGFWMQKTSRLSYKSGDGRSPDT